MESEDEETAKETTNEKNVTIAHATHTIYVYDTIRDKDGENIAETKAINIPKTKDIKLR